MSGDDGVDEMPFHPKDDVTDDLERYVFEGIWLRDSNEPGSYEDAWDEVVKIYDQIPEAHTTIIRKSDGKSEGTALHVALDLNYEKVAGKLVKAIIKHHTVVDVLQKVDEHGDTPLHVAASRGFARICKLLLENRNINYEERMYLMRSKNKRGETPLFIAAINRHKQAFAYLNHIYGDTVVLADLVRDDDGDSILHCAIEREFFDLAVIIVHYYDFLSTHKNQEGSIPLKVLATKPNAFRSGISLPWWKHFLYNCIFVEPLDPESTMKWNLKRMMEQSQSDKINFPKNYATLYQFFSHGLRLTGLSSWQRDPENQSNNEIVERIEVSPTNQKVKFLPANYATIQQFVKFGYVYILGLSRPDLKSVQEMKHCHQWSNQLLKALTKRPYSTFIGAGGLPGATDSSVDEDMLSQLSRERKQLPPLYPGTSATQESISTDTLVGKSIKSKTLEGEQGEAKILTVTMTDSKEGPAYEIDITNKRTKSDDYKNDTKETPFLVAASNGIAEMVDQILNIMPPAIHNTNLRKENVLIVAVKNRHPFVVERIRKRLVMTDKLNIWNNLTLGVDEDDNTMFHLAAKALRRDQHRQMTGSAFQMMWDITWFQYIERLVPKHFYFRRNKDKKTAGEIFQESHEDLVKDSGEWLKDTSQSCSVVAALVAGVSFATASAIPGDYNEEGKPRLEAYTAFNIFAISGLIGLCFSVTGLIMFLCILTSRKEAKAFRRDLPVKLLLGLSSIFVSIAAMFVSFCTGQVFLLNGKYRALLIPIYAATSLPVTLYAIAQFPLYIDLLVGIISKVPMATVKGSIL